MYKSAAHCSACCRPVSLLLLQHPLLSVWFLIISAFRWDHNLSIVNKHAAKECRELYSLHSVDKSWPAMVHRPDNLQTDQFTYWPVHDWTTHGHSDYCRYMQDYDVEFIESWKKVVSTVGIMAVFADCPIVKS